MFIKQRFCPPFFVIAIWGQENKKGGWGRSTLVTFWVFFFQHYTSPIYNTRRVFFSDGRGFEKTQLKSAVFLRRWEMKLSLVNIIFYNNFIWIDPTMLSFWFFFYTLKHWRWSNTNSKIFRKNVFCSFFLKKKSFLFFHFLFLPQPLSLCFGRIFYLAVVVFILFTIPFCVVHLSLSHLKKELETFNSIAKEKAMCCKK